MKFTREQKETFEKWWHDTGSTAAVKKAKLIFGVNTGVYYKWSNKLAQGETILPENGRERKLGGGRTHTCKAANENFFVDTLRTLKEETKMDIPFQTAQVLLFQVAKPLRVATDMLRGGTI